MEGEVSASIERGPRFLRWAWTCLVLSLFLSAHSPDRELPSVTVIVHPSTPAREFSSEELKNLLLGKSTKWSNGTKVILVGLDDVLLLLVVRLGVDGHDATNPGHAPCGVLDALIGRRDDDGGGSRLVRGNIGSRQRREHAAESAHTGAHEGPVLPGSHDRDDATGVPGRATRSSVIGVTETPRPRAAAVPVP